MTTQNGRAFNEWLRAQLKAKKMSQRQLAQQSGVDHSTISRLIRGDRMPSLGTATKLARGLRELRDDADTPQYLGLVAAGNTNPTARVEYALRADELLSEPQVRQIMEYYLAVRMRRYGRAFQPTEINAGCRSGTGADPGSDRHIGQPGRGHDARDRQHGPSHLTHRRSGTGALLSTHLGTTRVRPPRSGSRGQRTPASGAPAFAIPPRSMTRRQDPARYTEIVPSRGRFESIDRFPEAGRRRDDRLGRTAACRADGGLVQGVADDHERSAALRHGSAPAVDRDRRAGADQGIAVRLGRLEVGERAQRQLVDHPPRRYAPPPGRRRESRRPGGRPGAGAPDRTRQARRPRRPPRPDPPRPMVRSVSPARRSTEMATRAPPCDPATAPRGRRATARPRPSRSG